MSVRLFVAGLLCGAFALSAGATVLALSLMGQGPVPLLLAAGCALLLLLATVLAAEWSLARPIRAICSAMGELAKSGTGTMPPLRGWAPAEIRSLERSVSQFAAGADAVHRQDAEISRVKSDFISTAAHQLRTPLTGIRWALEALELEPLTDAQKEIVASAAEKSRQLVGVVGTLLDISSIESGKYKYDMRPGDLAALAEAVTLDFGAQAEAAKVSLAYQGAALPMVSMDRDRIRWVLNNLVENAIRYTPEGGSVRVSASHDGRRAFVRVRDTGIGIGKADRANIFERFYRAPGAIAKQNAGNGLGLYIARTVATDHRGDLEFASNAEGVGTTFTLSLPLA